ncbi:MAG TPA: oxygen-independent coproporphyrinogen III oxidase [Parvularculaceae bacterium]|nr:oxygen-independent coproporphyrinogen III oxidase [Parvularculaceae bacterium]
MKASWRKYLSARAPRYTSYPSALYFDSSVTGEDLAEKLRDVQLYQPLSLYVHVPFCRKLCWYCGCNMRVSNRYDYAADYVDALLMEIAAHAKSLEGRGRPTSVHFGGGTPNYLKHEDIGRILAAIEAELGLTDDACLSIELDPRILSQAYVEEIAALGFRRFSLGVQDFDPAVQAAINRIQDFDLVERCVSDIRMAGIRDLSFDLLYGLPRQSEMSFAATIEKTIALSPDRVSVFGYAHLPTAIPRQRAIDASEIPDDDLRCLLAEIADEKLIAAGYVRVGFDHYAKPDNALARAAAQGRLRRNFQGFSDDPADAILGLGASAISHVDGLYAQNVKSINEYVARVRTADSPTDRGIVRTRREAVFAAAISDLLCRMEADVSVVLKAATPEDATRICGALQRFEADGVLSWTGDRIKMVEGAHALSRAVAAALDPRAVRQAEFAAAV